MPHPLIRLALSLLFTIHFAGIFVAALAASISTAYQIFPDQTTPSPVSQEAEQAAMTSESSPNIWLLDCLEPYLDVCYLNHGYNFLAPDPGASLLIHYTVERQNGESIQGFLPDLKKHWPRLRYHRHFMLSSHSLKVLPPTAANAYAKHLMRLHNGRKITLDLVQHNLLSPEEVLDGKPLDDPSTYSVLGSVTEQAEGSP